MKYTTLLFDLDDTLLDFGKTESFAMERLFADYGIAPTQENKRIYVELNKAKWRALEKKEITREELFKTRFTEFFALMNIDADGIKANSEFISYVSQGSYLIDGALETCRILHENYRIFIITNGSKKAQHGRLTGSPLMEYIDGVFISEEIGFVKPEKGYFEYVLNSIEEKDKSRILVIGDSLDSDIAGALNSGLDCCWLNNSSEHKENYANYEIFNIMQVLEILKV